MHHGGVGSVSCDHGKAVLHISLLFLTEIHQKMCIRDRERVIQDMDVQNKKLVDAYYKTDYYASIMGPATNAINNLALALISVFGAILYLHGSISIGSISAFVLYLSLIHIWRRRS